MALTPDNIAGLNTTLNLKIDLFVLIGSLTPYQLEESFTPLVDDPSSSEEHELLTQGVHFIAGLDSRSTEIITKGSQLDKKIEHAHAQKRAFPPACMRHKTDTRELISYYKFGSGNLTSPNQ